MKHEGDIHEGERAPRTPTMARPGAPSLLSEQSIASDLWRPRLLLEKTAVTFSCTCHYTTTDSINRSTCSTNICKV